MGKKAFGVQVYTSRHESGYEFRHLAMEVRIVEVCDAARDVAAAAKRGYGVDSARESLDEVLKASGGKSTAYLSGSSTVVKFRWQSDRDNGFDKWYAFRVDSLDVDCDGADLFRRVFKVLDSAGAVGFDARPWQVWEALRSAGAVVLENIRGMHCCYLEGELPAVLCKPAAVQVETV